MHTSHSATDVNLLARLRANQDDPAAWRQFVNRYGPRIHDWCTARKLQPHDADDVTQNVLVKMVQTLAAFDYDAQQTFRGWLRRVVENAVTDFVRERCKAGGVNHNFAHLAQLEEVASREDLLARLSEVFDLELLEAAMGRVRGRVDARRWMAWELAARQQVPTVEIARQLDMKPPTIYSARYQVQKLISEEIQTLEKSSGPE